jgi:hypothetical protein
MTRAIEAFESALTIFTRDTVPATWLSIQNSLGVALTRQGEGNLGEAGLALIKRAVAAFDATLTICTPEHFGHLHTMAVHNRDLALALIAKRNGA